MGEENTGIAAPGDLDAAADRRVTNKKDKSNLYGVLILLVVVLISGAGIFFLQQLRSEQEGLGGALDKGDRRIATLNDQLTAVQNQMSTLQSQLATMQTSLANRESKFERELADFKAYQEDRIAATRSELSDSIFRIQSLLNRTRGDWMIADAEYLLGVANQRLKLVGDVKTALTALKAADQRLRDSGNPGVYKVREQVAREINTLTGFKPVDVVGVFSRIRVLEDQVENLPTFLPHAGAVRGKIEKDQSDAGKTEEISGVNEFVDSAIEDLKGLVVVRRSDREIDVVLQPEEVRIIREELRIKLEVARLAFLQRDSKLFLQNIAEAKDLLKSHFRPEAAESKQFDEELDELAKIGPDIDYPDISKSMTLLEKIASLRVENEQPGKASVKEAKPVPDNPVPAAPETVPAEGEERVPQGARP